MNRRQLARSPLRLSHSMAAQRFGAACAMALLLALPSTSGVWAQTLPADFIFDRSHEVALTPAQLEGMSKDQLRLARNEIFARRGYIFSSADLRDYFAAKSWYRPVTSELNKLSLSPTEQANIALIKRFEEQGHGKHPPLPAATSSPPPAPAGITQAAIASGNVVTAIRSVDCENLEATVKAQAWNADGAPFGKPYGKWVAADFDAINKYAAECTRLLQQRNVPQAGLMIPNIYSFLMPLQAALARGDQQRADEAQVAEWRERNRRWTEQKQEEMAQLQAQAAAKAKSDRRAIEDRAEASAASRVDDFKLLGIGPDLLNSNIYMEYIGGPRKILSFYHFIGLALANTKLEKVNTRRWNIGEGSSNAIEVMYKIKGRPTKGLLFVIDGEDMFANFLVENDELQQFKANTSGAALRSQMVRDITGIADDEWTSLFID